MVLREMNTTPTFRIYRNGVQQTALEATFPADEWSIPLFRAQFLPFTSKIVEHSRYLLPLARRNSVPPWPEKNFSYLALLATAFPDLHYARLRCALVAYTHLVFFHR